MTDTLRRLEQLETTITYSEPPPPGSAAFRYVPGRLPVLISAPHGAAHRRDGHLKEEDEYTAAFAQLVAERSGAHVLYTWAQSDDDPNWNIASPYKERLRRLIVDHDIRFVLDIHGMGDRHKFGVAIGTMCGASCPQRHEHLIRETLTASGFHEVTAQEARAFPALRWDRFVVNHGRFTGGLTSYTVTRFAAQELGVRAAQVELCASLRIARRRATTKWPREFRGDPVGIVRAVTTVAALVTRLEEALD